jgi:hypothetical protein
MATAGDARDVWLNNIRKTLNISGNVGRTIIRPIEQRALKDHSSGE